MFFFLDRCLHRHAFVFDHGIIGNTPTGDILSVLSSLTWILPYPFSMSRVRYTNAISLSRKENVLSDPEYEIIVFEARADGSSGDIQLLLPPKDDIGVVLGIERWLTRQAESEALGLNAATQIEMVGIYWKPTRRGACRVCGWRSTMWR
jgi:nitrite reductase (NAD(P)H)